MVLTKGESMKKKGSVLTGQRTKDNIKAIMKTEAVATMLKDLAKAKLKASSIPFNRINTRYAELGGNEEVQPMTLGAVQEAMSLKEDQDEK